MWPECSEQEAEWMTGSKSDMLGLESWVECHHSYLGPGYCLSFQSWNLVYAEASILGEGQSPLVD